MQKLKNLRHTKIAARAMLGISVSSAVGWRDILHTGLMLQAEARGGRVLPCLLASR
jgi:hypothetical protein